FDANQRIKIVQPVSEIVTGALVSEVYLDNGALGQWKSVFKIIGISAAMIMLASYTTFILNSTATAQAMTPSAALFFQYLGLVVIGYVATTPACGTFETMIKTRMGRIADLLAGRISSV